MFTPSRMNLTGGRKEEWKQFTQMRRNRVITVEQYNAMKADLERREAKAQKIRATAQAKRDVKKAQRKAEKAVVQAAVKSNKEKEKVEVAAKVQSVVQPDT